MESTIQKNHLRSLAKKFLKFSRKIIERKEGAESNEVAELVILLIKCSGCPRNTSKPDWCMEKAATALPEIERILFG